MTGETKTDDMGGFQLIGRDDATGTVTIAVHRYVLKHSSDELAQRLKEIGEENPNIQSIVVTIRESSLTAKPFV